MRFADQEYLYKPSTREERFMSERMGVSASVEWRGKVMLGETLILLQSSPFSRKVLAYQRFLMRL